MAYKLRTTPQTKRDIDSTTEYYKKIRRDLAKQFLNELESVKKYISKNPEKIQVRHNNIRIAFLKKFPYSLHFHLKENTITIIALFGTSEDPNKWNERTSLD